MELVRRTGIFVMLATVLAITTACVETSGGGGAPILVEDPAMMQIDIPTAVGVSPSDILDQVVFEGTGGSEGEKWCPCIYVEEGVLYLEGFSPNQSLILVAYDEYEQGFGSYYTHWFVNVDSAGYLAIAPNGYKSNHTFVAFNPSTGEQEGPMNRVVYPFLAVSSSSSAQISSQVEGVNLRSSPGYSDKNDSVDIIAILASGDIVEIVDGPSSADGLQWWLVSWNGYTGWIAESTKNGRTILEFNR